ncbi:hypothetical protein ACSQ67_023046 [Phaseolus vulgaris]
MDGPGLGVVKGGYDVWYTRLPRVETSILFDHCGGSSDGWTGQTITGFSLEDFDAGWTFSSDVCELRLGCREKGKQNGRSRSTGLEPDIALCEAGSRH